MLLIFSFEVRVKDNSVEKVGLIKRKTLCDVAAKLKRDYQYNRIVLIKYVVCGDIA
jgi:hypothetical protein